MIEKSNKENIIVDVKDVIRFINDTEFKGYQSINLPFGLKTPGMDRSKTADIIFKYAVKDKSVLDIGCKYGYFCHEAIIRGANIVDGVEISPENVEIAKKIVKLWNRNINIIEGDFLEKDINKKYDVVLFLNVLHHIISPVAVMQKIADKTQELAIIEFPTILDNHTGLSSVKKIIYKMFFNKFPLTYLGKEKYHRLWYFSEKAFTNLVIEQLSIFQNVEFFISPRKKGRVIAFCWK